MKSVILVDDEILVRVGLKSLLNWGEIGYKIVGEFGNADTAKEYLKNNSVNFILTDLYMKPGNGFELIEWVRKEQINTGIIVLSCHNEFDDVQKALRLGADDYIFKLSMNQEEILNAFLRVESKYGVDIIPSMPKDSIKSNIKRDELETFLEENVDGETVFYNICTFTYLQPDLIVSFRDILIDNGFTDFSFIYDSQSLIYCCEKYQSEENIMKLIENFNRISEKYITSPLFLGLHSGEFSDHDTIYNGVKESKEASSLSFYDLGRNYYFYNELKLKKEQFYDELLKEDFFSKIESLRDSINRNSFEEINTTVIDLFDILQRVSPPVISTSRHYIMDILTTFRTKLHAYNILLSEIEEDNENSLVTVIIHGNTLSKIKNKFLNFIDIYQNRIRLSPVKIRPDIESAMQYIEIHCTEGINLVDIAEFSNMNASYFSHIFKKETKYSVIDYLHLMQIERAKELLLTNKYMVYEVSELIGIQNANYFSTLFKKVSGKSPQDYINR